MTFSETRKNFSSFLERARIDGEAIIKRANGLSFKVTPIIEEKESPFECVNPILKSKNITKEDLHKALDDSKNSIEERYAFLG